MSFSLDGGSEVFVDVQSSLKEKADALEALGFPITNISQSKAFSEFVCILINMSWWVG